MQIVCGWTGDAFVPLRKTTDFIVGHRYLVEALNMQSGKARGLFHATIAEAYVNLPEDQAQQFLSLDHFRYWLTIKAGFFDDQYIVCESNSEADRMALAARRLSPYSVVERKNKTVRILTAKSTKQAQMSGKDFSELVDAVIPLASEMIKVHPDHLKLEGQSHGR